MCVLQLFFKKSALRLSSISNRILDVILSTTSCMLVLCRLHHQDIIKQGLDLFASLAQDDKNLRDLARVSLEFVTALLSDDQEDPEEVIAAGERLWKKHFLLLHYTEVGLNHLPHFSSHHQPSSPRCLKDFNWWA